MSEPFNYKLYRYSSQENSTLGLLMAAGEKEEFRCYTLEDEFREVKVPGKTRIPAGRYEIRKRFGSAKFGHLDEKYDWHDGMLWLQDVPGFEWIYIHTGNRHEHTEGCILVGDGAESNREEDGMVTHSRKAYESLYREISGYLDEGHEVFIEVVDHA